MCLLPFWGLTAPRENEIFVTTGVNGEFWCEWRVCVSSTDALVIFYNAGFNGSLSHLSLYDQQQQPHR